MDPTRKKLAIMGASNTGKTSLLMRYINREFPKGYVPPTIENKVADVPLGSRRVELLLIESTGFPSYPVLDRLAFSEVDVILLCFSIISVDSFRRIPNLWADVRRCISNTPVVLAGTKKDIALLRRGHMSISTEEGNHMSERISAVGYVECSAKTGEGVEEVFNTAARSSVQKKKRNSVVSLFSCAKPAKGSEKKQRYSLH